MRTRTNYFPVEKYDHPLLEEMVYNWDDESGVVELVNNAYRLGLGKWVPLSEQKPTEGKRYLVYREGIGGSPGSMDVVHWFQPIGDFFCSSITHWMELPLPPAGSP